MIPYSTGFVLLHVTRPENTSGASCFARDSTAFSLLIFNDEGHTFTNGHHEHNGLGEHS